VRIAGAVGVLVVDAVVRGPPQWAELSRAGAEHGAAELHRP